MSALSVELRPYATGRTAFAAEPLRKGHVCCVEPPYAAVQTLASRRRTLACTHCLQPLGPLAAVVAAATHASGCVDASAHMPLQR